MRRFVVMLLGVVLFIAAPLSASASAVPTVSTPIWAGYNLQGLDKFNPNGASIGGTWVVPTVKCPKVGKDEVSIWVGLGGTEESGELEQIGTLATCVGHGRARHTGIYQMYGRQNWGSARKLNKDEYPLQPGDKVQASVGYILSTVKGEEVGTYTLTLRNITQGWYFLTQEDGSTSAASHNSAEWIVEAVTRGSGQAQHVPPLANFGSVTFTNCSADGKPISSWTHAKVQITQPSNHFLLASNKHKAYPSSLQKGGKNFTVTWSK